MVPSTPPPSSPVRLPRTPRAPRLGFHDDWEPYPPRKSARLSAQRISTRTPSPPPAARQPAESPRTTKKAIVHSDALMASPAQESPRKKRQPIPKSVRRVSSDAQSSAAAALGFQDKPVQKPLAAPISASAAMLPTPSKTPQKPPCEKTAANIKSFARNLFPSEETAMATPRKKRSKMFSGVAVESFAGEEAEDPISIFTDSKDRVPIKDAKEANPFFNAAQHESPRRSKRRQIMIPGEGFQSIEEASRREDGMIYVFRGKKFFRKFAEAEAGEHADSEEEVETHMGRALTRSSIKPRLLFPVKKTEKTKEMLEEEEGSTEVEEGVEGPEEEEEEEEDCGKAQAQTPAKPERAQTPEAPKFAPVSPPDTKRVTRSTNKAPTPMKATKKRSPFDSWRRTKESGATPTAGKRTGEPLASANVKRTRA